MSLVTPTVAALDLSALNLTDMPVEVTWHAHHLLELNLAANALTSLPSSLCACSILQRLMLDFNRFSVMPVHTLANLAGLEVCYSE